MGCVHINVIRLDINKLDQLSDGIIGGIDLSFRLPCL